MPPRKKPRCRAYSYRSRDELLRARKIAKTYREYLSCGRWKAIRQRVIDRFGGRCALCQADAEIVHHSKYRHDNLSGASTIGMWPLCRPCHRLVEFDECGRKRTFHEARDVWNALYSIARPRTITVQPLPQGKRRSFYAKHNRQNAEKLQATQIDAIMAANGHGTSIDVV